MKENPDDSYPPRTSSCSSPPPEARVSKVLVVEDNVDLNHMLRERLEQLGFDAEGVCSGEEAMQRLHVLEPDIIFVDVTLPGMSGMEVLGMIRAQALDAAVVMTTAFGSEHVAADALRRGADDYVPKTVVLSELETIVERTVRRLKLNRQNAALRKQLDEKRRLLELELGRAARVQSELLPSSLPSLRGFELAARCVPAREVGGDFYDWQSTAPGIFTLTLCDVMGKGMPAALLMATVRATLRAVVRNSPPVSAMRYVVSALSGDLERSGSLVTMFLGQIDVSRRTIRFVDAGHGHVFVLRATGELSPLSPRGLPLGVVDEAEYEEGEIQLHPGDSLVLYSDGLVETDPSGPLEQSALAACLKGQHTAQGMVEELLHLGAPAGPPPDDLTVVVLRCCL